MQEQIRQYRVASGGAYIQTRHFDDNGGFVGEYWERKQGDVIRPLGFAAYVSWPMCTKIANNYTHYQQLGRFDRSLLRKLICMGKREHFSGHDGRIVYIAHATSIFTSSQVVEITPPFEQVPLGDTQELPAPNSDSSLQN